LARLDERLTRLPVRDGFVERQHFADAAAALWLEGELVHLEDLVLHDAHMDVRTPTHELTRAHAVLRTRRQIFARPPDWALGRDGSLVLTGRGAGASDVEGQKNREGEGVFAPEGEIDEPVDADEPDPLAQEFAAIDAVLERAARVLEGGEGTVRKEEMPLRDRPALVYDLDWNEEERLAEWQDVLAETSDLPGVLRAAILLEAWSEIEVLQHTAWLGPAAGGRAATAGRLCGPSRRPASRRQKDSAGAAGARTRNERLHASLDAIHEAALAGLKEHDRLMLAKNQMERRLKQRGASSKLPDLVDLVLSRPLVSTGMIQDRLKISKQGALNLIGELGLREMTGRGRFRAWGIL
jgi:hypothetical protein